MYYQIYKLKQRLRGFLRLMSDWALFIGIVLIGGIGSHWYMVQAGSMFSVSRIGPWESWENAARHNSDPYTRAHFARLGILPLSTDISRTYVARHDDDGDQLYSSCDYAIEGHDFAARWWSITVFDDDGALIPNPAGRYAFSRETVAITPEGGFVISMARDARAGNWIPTGGAGSLSVMLVLQNGNISVAESRRQNDEETLPKIVRVKCR
ncbi:MAG TPA: DUF1214 domain-containing protein [Hyphomicrobiaceae bacterium]|nr:DUF1214 domain-containing protein [Hyphomicrobiaceae bacterium]